MAAPKKTKKRKQVTQTVDEQKAALIESLLHDADDEFVNFMLGVKKRYDVEQLIKEDKGRPPKTFAYLRVSTRDQTFGSQLTALHKAGYEIPKEDCFTDKISGGISDRDGWNDMLATLQRGDTVVAYHVDRIGREMVDNIEKIRFLTGNGIRLRVVTFPLPLDADSRITDLVVTVLSSIGQAQKERQNKSIKLGIEARRRDKKRIGPVPFSDAVRADVYNLYMNGLSVYEIRQLVKKRHGLPKGIGKRTVYDIINEYKLTDAQKAEAKAARKAHKKGEFSLDGNGGLTPEEIAFMREQTVTTDDKD